MKKPGKILSFTYWDHDKHEVNTFYINYSIILDSKNWTNKEIPSVNLKLYQKYIYPGCFLKTLFTF